MALHNPSAQSYTLSVHPLLPRKTGWPVEAEGDPGQHELRVELVEKQFVAKNCAVFCEERGPPRTLSNLGKTCHLFTSPDWLRAQGSGTPVYNRREALLRGKQ